MRMLLAAPVLVAILAAPVLAQSTPPMAPVQTPAEKAVEATKTMSDAAKNAAAATGQMMKNAGAAMAVNLSELTNGWNLRRSVIGQSVYNEQNERIGEIDDVILVPERNMAYVVVGVGGFLGMGERNVVTPMAALRRIDNRFILAGVTKDGLKIWPEYKYPAF